VLIIKNNTITCSEEHIFKLEKPCFLMKRGLSDVVTTLLIILLAFASVTIIWVVAKTFILQSVGQMDVGQFNNYFSVPASSVQVNDELGFVIFNVKRDSGDGEVTKLNVILADKDGTSKNFPQEIGAGGFNIYESRKMMVSYLGLIDGLSSISISATITTSEGKQISTTPMVAYTVKGSEKLAGNLLWLDFENGITDKSGYGNSGTMSGVTIAADDTASPNKKAGNVATFAGAGSIDFGDSSALDLGTGNFTITFWAKSSNADGQILGKLGTNGNGYGVAFNIFTGGFYLTPTIGAGTTNSPQYGAEQNNLITPGNWVFYVIIFNRDAKEIKVYAGSTTGNLILSSDPNNYNNLGTASIDNPDSFIIGKLSNGAIPYTGKLDDVRVFSKALSLAEANKIYLETRIFS